MRKIILLSTFAVLTSLVKAQPFEGPIFYIYQAGDTIIGMGYFDEYLNENPIYTFGAGRFFRFYSDTIKFDCMAVAGSGTTPNGIVGVDANGNLQKHTIASLGILPSTAGNEGDVLRVNSGGTGVEWAAAGSSLTNTATLDFTSTAAGAVTDLTITVTGAAVGDVVVIGTPNGSVPATGCYFGWVSSTNTVTIRYVNNGLVSAVDPASGTFRATVIKP